MLWPRSWSIHPPERSLNRSAARLELVHLIDIPLILDMEDQTTDADGIAYCQAWASEVNRTRPKFEILPHRARPGGEASMTPALRRVVGSLHPFLDGRAEPGRVQARIELHEGALAVTDGEPGPRAGRAPERSRDRFADVVDRHIADHRR